MNKEFREGKVGKIKKDLLQNRDGRYNAYKYVLVTKGGGIYPTVGKKRSIDDVIVDYRYTIEIAEFFQIIF